MLRVGFVLEQKHVYSKETNFFLVFYSFSYLYIKWKIKYRGQYRGYTETIYKLRENFSNTVMIYIQNYAQEINTYLSFFKLMKYLSQEG